MRHRITNITTSNDYPYGVFYIAGNFMAGDSVVSADNWKGGVDTEANVKEVKADRPFYFVPIPVQSAEDAYNSVLKYAGASHARDAVDRRIITEVRNGTTTCMGKHTMKPGIIDTQDDAGGWPELHSFPAPADQDHDGMPDGWEKKYHLDINDPSDGGLYSIDRNYTNLEVYLNSLVE